jgi:DNA uptake protein ComE-like DNA-binding protein
MAINKNKKALVLVGVLWTVALLTVIAASVGHNSRLDMKVSAVRTEQLRCKWACRAGIEKAIGVLNEDLRESDCLTDLWSDNDEDFNNISLEKCWFSVKVIDESSKLNINTITKQQLLELPYMEEDIADAIIDWRDGDDTPGTAGVEGGYYENLPIGYKIRNGPFKTIRELLLVKGVTEELLYGEDTNFNGLLDYNERDGNESPPNDNSDDVLDVGWIAYLTCYSYDKNVDADGNQRVNINQANERQLQNSLGIRGSQAQWIVERRQNNRFSSIADLLDNSSSQQTQRSSQQTQQSSQQSQQSSQQSQQGSQQSPQQSSQRNSRSSSTQSEPVDLQTFYEIADKITVDSGNQTAGKVNINTAPKGVLIALLGGSESDVQTAENIVAYRASLMNEMQSIAELLEAGLVNTETFRRIANNITTRSDVFTIRCFATADRGGVSGTTLQTEVVVDRSQSPYTTLYWYQGASNL